jgi:hypothetical protein
MLSPECLRELEAHWLHAAWHHPRTAHLTVDAGIVWLHHVAGLNPATSHVIRAWDSKGAHDWPLRAEVISAS